MATSYTHLTYADMVKIETLVAEGQSDAEIGIKIGKDRTTIWRIATDSGKQARRDFSAEKCWQQVSERKSSANKHYRILSDTALEEYILTHIELHWSPEQIAGRWTEQTGEALCHETIYQWVYKYHPQLVKLHFRRKGKKYIKNRKEKYRIDERRMIDERPEAVEERKEVGHWEGDTIVGKGHKGAIVTNVERKSGLLIASKVERATAENIFDVTVNDFSDVPPELKISMTYDNGKEFAWHKMIEGTTKITVYFAHPYSPWERGSNENTNGLLREFIPKGTDFSTVSADDLVKYVHLINNRPRKRLGFRTPLEVFNDELAAVAVDPRI